MSKRRYNFRKMSQEQLAELGQRFPAAVEVITIRRPVYSTLAISQSYWPPLHIAVF